MGQNENFFFNMNEANPVLKAIMNRRFDKLISNHAVSRSLIEILLDSGMRITTSQKTVPWSYVVIQDEDYLRYLRECATVFDQIDSYVDKQIHEEHEIQLDHQTSTELIVMYANTDLPFSLSDCWQSIENILLASSALGLSVSLDCSLLKVLNSIKIKNELRVPEDLSVMYTIYLGAHNNSYLPSIIQKPTIWSWISKC